MITETTSMDKTFINKIASHPLQSWEWGDFRKKWGNEVLVTKYGLVTLHKLPVVGRKIGMFIKGPKPTEKMLKDLKRVAKENNLSFIKLEPNTKRNNNLVSLLRSSGAGQGKTLFTPTTFWIDLTKSEEELLKSFHGKTRYNIKYAQRKGVTVTEDNSDKAFEEYLKLTRETIQRQGFYAHTEHYHRLMWATLKKAGIAHLLTAKYKGEILTVWIVFTWKDGLYYPYGASSGKHQNLQANSLMMWEAIRFGKKHHLKTFDLWGREEGKGFTRFKEGFSPDTIELLGTWDLVIDKKMYRLYRLAEAIRWPLLRLKSRLLKPTF